jgi:chromate transporter
MPGLQGGTALAPLAAPRGALVSSSAMADSPADTPAPGRRASIQPTLLELLGAFTQVSVAAFGGALPWSRRMIVERKRWMTNDEFNETFALSQFLPGPNTINFSVVFGSRFGGAAGAAAALTGLIGPPLVIVMVLGVLYERYGNIDTLGHILAGIASAASGLLIASVGKMAAPMFMKKWDSAPPIAILAFIGVALLHWPLPYVFVGLAPLAIALAWVRR